MAPGSRDTEAPAVQISGLTRTFTPPGGQEVRALRGVDLCIGNGEVIALLGPNGAGKTTALDIVLGLTDATSGPGGHRRHRWTAGRAVLGR